MARKKYKQQILSKVTFTGIADKGQCVGRDEEGRVVFVENVVPGDVADVLVLRKRKGIMQGVPTHIYQYSPDRVNPFCQHYGVCGGCKWQDLSYEAQLRHKQKVVEDAIYRIAKITDAEMLPILGGASTRYYRNKLEFSFSNRRWLTREEIEAGLPNEENVLGFHRAGAFDKVVDVKHCWLQYEPSNELRNGIKAIAIEQGLSFHDAKVHEGFMRQSMFRITSLGEILVLLGFHQNDTERIHTFLEAVLNKFPQITTLCYCINPKVNDYLFDLDMHTYHGPGFVRERLGHVHFKVGPKSFFQTNTQQAEVLYQVAADFAQLKGTENVYDLYTGIGSIALFIAKNCRQVVGIEEIPEAIEDALENAALNGITNARFYAGDVKDLLTTEFAAQHGKPDLLITDPPRAGMHPKVVQMLLELESPRMVYVSCNPATQARDLLLLAEKYRLVRFQPVDMFPHTHHIENVALLELK
ncbi:MAG TPA: 23S rRNA (uracil(1939)-C(5))-methyltransferase RlmD [Saprospiraceae bacterium]|nr:23S rRNA (uracil(1939)-C(5))-methyltransferase RlmD [Saprospiraceae bacterium]HMQ85435.1 23S rRNA (uracil(1939)-C(5))-methyltransferase RlmD [Saprospiraceae bacterium]